MHSHYYQELPTSGESTSLVAKMIRKEKATLHHILIRSIAWESEAGLTVQYIRMTPA